jgi:hypothetical protein
MSAAKRIASTTVKAKPEDIVAPIVRAINNVRMYVGTEKGVTAMQLDVIERAVVNAMIDIEVYGDRHREAGSNTAYMNLPLTSFTDDKGQ